MDKRFVMWSVSVAAIIVVGYLATSLATYHPTLMRGPMRRLLWRVPLPAATSTLTASSTLAFATTTPPQALKKISIGGNTLRVTVVSTEASRERGLSGRTGLQTDEGMLFAFPTDGTYGFWMKDMLFPIDMIWISADKHIVYMAENVAPGTYPKSFVPTQPARYVLEVPAGYAHGHSIKVGELVSL